MLSDCNKYKHTYIYKYKIYKNEAKDVVEEYKQTKNTFE